MATVAFLATGWGRGVFQSRYISGRKKDMIHYTTVKTNMFNGIHHPSIAIRHTNGEIEVLREYRYEDYRDRMD